jgi:hypothetical protein
LSLRADVDAALASMASAGSATRLALDAAGTCRITLPMPASVVSLADGRLVVDVRLSPTERFVSLSSPLAGATERVRVETWATLLRRQHVADQVGGAGLALDDEHGLVEAVDHWPLPTITEAEWAAWFDAFVAAVYQLIDEVRSVSRQDPAVQPVHP